MKARAAIMAACLGFAVALPAAANAFETVTIGNVNLRSGGGIEYARIGALPRGRAVRVTVCRDGWCLISARGLTGWVATRYLAEVGAVERFRPTVVATPPIVKFRLVVPRAYHDLGRARHHEPTRRFHE